MKLNNINVKDMGFHLNPLYSISAPEPKIYIVEIPFSDKVIDLTESFGKVTYYPREIQFTLEKLRPKDAWLDAYNSFVQSYHGKSVRLVVPYDDTHYFNGRLVASSMVRGDFMSFSVTVTCDPYRYKNEITEVNVSVAGTQEVILTNEQKPVVPTIITDASVQVIHGANSYSINAGTHRLPIVLEQGDTSVQFIGTANVSITYQEGAL